MSPNPSGHLPPSVHAWPSGPPTPLPVVHRRATSGWWTGYAFCLALGVLLLLMGHDVAVEVRQVESDDGLAEVAGEFFVGFPGAVLTLLATTFFVVATVLGAVGLRGAARWAAPVVSGLAAVGSLVALHQWFLPWLT